MAKFPKQVFVKWEDGGSGPNFLGTYEDSADTVMTGEKVKVGVYQLVDVLEVTGTHTLRKVRR